MIQIRGVMIWRNAVNSWRRPCIKCVCANCLILCLYQIACGVLVVSNILRVRSLIVIRSIMKTKYTVVYDAQCVVWDLFRRWVQRRDHRFVLFFLGNTDRRVKEISLEPALVESTLVCIFPDGQVTHGAQAVFYVLSQTGGKLGFLAGLLRNRFASWLFEPGYRLFARHRGRFAWLARVLLHHWNLT